MTGRKSILPALRDAAIAGHAGAEVRIAAIGSGKYRRIVWYVPHGSNHTLLRGAPEVIDPLLEPVRAVYRNILDSLDTSGMAVN